MRRYQNWLQRYEKKPKDRKKPHKMSCGSWGVTPTVVLDSPQQSPLRGLLYSPVSSRRHQKNQMHIHAIYNEYVGLFNIKTFEMFEGDLPAKAQELVREWLSLHSDEFQEMWDNQLMTKLPPLRYRELER